MIINLASLPSNLCWWGLQSPTWVFGRFGWRSGKLYNGFVELDPTLSEGVLIVAGLVVLNSPRWGLQNLVCVFGRKMVGGLANCTAVFELCMLLQGASMKKAGIGLKSSRRRRESDWFRVIWWPYGRDFGRRRFALTLIVKTVAIMKGRPRWNQKLIPHLNGWDCTSNCTIRA